MKKIKLGYEIGTGKQVDIKISHLIVTGLTQEAGKTTTLESLIKSSGKRAIVFRTKIGEKSFLEGTIIPPYFKDRSDWQFIQGLVEATIKEKLRTFERAKIIQICKKSGDSLVGFKKRVDERLLEKINSFEMDILTNLQAYLDIILPKLQSINFSKELDLVDGLNIIDLERFSRDAEVQSLIIRSVVEEVLHNFKDVIVVIPEFWKFSPQKRGNPCKLVIEEFVRQGATNENYIWIDAQDMTGVDKTPLKQVSNWILGYQSEKNEVKHTIEQIPLPTSKKPKPADVMSLDTGVFYLATREKTVKVYVQPFWLDDGRAKKIALGKLKISELDAPESKKPFALAIKKPEHATQQPSIDFSETAKRFNKELNEMRTDFFNKLAEVQEQFTKVHTDIYHLKNQPKQESDEETIIAKVLQKLPTTNDNKEKPCSQIDEETLISKIIARMPSGGTKVYKIAPIDKIKKDFLEEAKDKIISDVNSLKDREKKILKFVESQSKGCSVNFLMTNLFHIAPTSGSRKGVIEECHNLKLLHLMKFESKHGAYPELKNRIEELLITKDAKPEEIQQVYDHILMEMLGKE